MSGLSSGEHAVFAGEFVRRLALGQRSAEAAYGARCAVDCLHRVGEDRTIDDDTRAMVDAMLGRPR